MKIQFYIFLIIFIFNFYEANTDSTTQIINNSNKNETLKKIPESKESKEKVTNNVEKKESKFKIKLKKFFRQNTDTNLYIILVCMALTFIMVILIIIFLIILIKRNRKFYPFNEEKDIPKSNSTVEVDNNKRRYKMIPDKN